MYTYMPPEIRHEIMTYLPIKHQRKLWWISRYEETYAMIEENFIANRKHEVKTITEFIEEIIEKHDTSDSCLEIVLKCNRLIREFISKDIIDNLRHLHLEYTLNFGIYRKIEKIVETKDLLVLSCEKRLGEFYYYDDHFKYEIDRLTDKRFSLVSQLTYPEILYRDLIPDYDKKSVGLYNYW